MFNNILRYINNVILGHDDVHLLYQKDPTIIKSLLQKGANPNIQNKYGYTLLHNNENIDIIRLLLEYGADPNIKDNNGNTSLHGHVNIDIIKLLLENRADPNIQNNYGDTSLFYYDNIRNIDIIKLLIEHGADIHHLNNKKQNVLFYYTNISFYYTNIYMLKFYVDKGVDINQQDIYGKFAIDYISDKYKNDEIIELLTLTKSNTKSANKC